VNTENDLVVQSDFPAASIEVNVWAKLDAAALQAEGNRLFAKQDWTGSIEPYTKCIQKLLELVHQKPTSNKHKRKRAVENGTASNGKVVDETVILVYSNRAAASMKSCHYERALKDAYEALILEPHDLKSIHWKGCAFHGMQQYELACKCFELALEQSPEKDIKLALQKSKTCDTQSKLGVYELSKYLVGGFEDPLPEFRDYVGPDEIRSSEGSCR
jgi:tetratricopeptide (TPR) repeat protein